MNHFSKLILPFVGLLFFALGAVTSSQTPEFPWFSPFLWGIGGISFIIWAILSKDTLVFLFTRKGAKNGTNSGVTVLGTIVVIIALSYLSQRPRFNKSLDFTRDSINTLSDQTLKVIGKIKKEKSNPEILAFFQDEIMQEKFKGIISLYESKGLPLNISYIDPESDPTKAISEKITNANTAIFRLNERESRITSFTEEKITNSFISIMKDRQAKIYFTKGHGEGELSGQNAEAFDIVREELTANKYLVEELSILEKGSIPEDCDLLVIGGPKYDFKPEEIKLIENYTSKSGPVLLMMDALIEAKNLSGFLSNYGIKMENNFLVLRSDDQRAQLLGTNNAIVSNFDDRNPVTKDFSKKSSVALLMPFSRSLSKIDSNKNNLKVELVAKTGEGIVGISNVINQKDLQNISEDRIIQGPFDVIAVASGIMGTAVAEKEPSPTTEASDTSPSIPSSKEKELRIIAVGSSQFATNTGAQRAEHRDMFLNMANYLLQDEDFISIRPRDTTKSTISLTESSSVIWLAFLSYIYPFILLGIGIMYTYNRRQA